MANISKLNLTGADLDIADAYVRSLVPSNADPNTNQLATMADVGGGGGGGGFTKVYENTAPTSSSYDILTQELLNNINSNYNEFFVQVEYSNTPYHIKSCTPLLPTKFLDVFMQTLPTSGYDIVRTFITWSSTSGGDSTPTMSFITYTYANQQFKLYLPWTNINPASIKIYAK